MSTVLTRFEVQLPIFADDTAEATAVNTFENAIGALTTFISSVQYVYTSSTDPGTYTRVIYGLLTVAQQATALSALTTLNTALGHNVICTVNNVTSEP